MTPSYYSNGPAGAGWRRVASGTADQANYRIYPDDGIVVTRAGTGHALTFIKGMLKTGRTTIPMLRGMNIVVNVYPVAMTLASSGLFTGLRTGSAKTEDQVLIFNGISYDTYYYERDARLGTGWRKTGDPRTDVSTTEIPGGGAVGIMRRSAPFNWKIPVHPL